MQQNDTRDSEVIKDLAEFFNARLAQYMNRIDELNDQLVNDRTAILYINNELHKLFKHISAKLTSTELKQQWRYKISLSMLMPIVQKRSQDPNSEEIQQVYSMTTDYKRYSELVESREMHLYKCLEAAGLTSKEAVKSKRLR